jgi:hypothetical protein
MPKTKLKERSSDKKHLDDMMLLRLKTSKTEWYYGLFTDTSYAVKVQNLHVKDTYHFITVVLSRESSTTWE